MPTLGLTIRVQPTTFFPKFNFLKSFHSTHFHEEMMSKVAACSPRPQRAGCHSSTQSKCAACQTRILTRPGNLERTDSLARSPERAGHCLRRGPPAPSLMMRGQGGSRPRNPTPPNQKPTPSITTLPRPCANPLGRA